MNERLLGKLYTHVYSPSFFSQTAFFKPYLALQKNTEPLKDPKRGVKVTQKEQILVANDLKHQFFIETETLKYI